MSHLSHKDHINAVKAKRIREVLDDEKADRLEALIAAAQQKDYERPVYRELVNPGEVNQQGVQRS